MNNISSKNIVHHGVEAVSYVVLGTLATSDFRAASTAYAVGKITYIGFRTLLDSQAPQLSVNTKRRISWGVSLLAGGFTLQAAASESISGLVAGGITFGVTGASLGLRFIADKSFRYLTES